MISTDSLDGDIWTTLLFGLGVEKGCAALRQRQDIDAIFVTKIATLYFHRRSDCALRRWIAATALLTVLLKQTVLFGHQPVAIDRPPGGAVVDSGIENIDLRQPDQILTAGNAGDIHRRRQLIGREFNVRVGVNPLAQRAQGLRGQPLGQLARVAGLRRAAVQQAVNVGLLVIGLAGYQLALLPP